MDDDISTLQKRLELQKKEYEDNFSSNKQKEDQYHQSALDLAGQIKIIKDQQIVLEGEITNLNQQQKELQQEVQAEKARSDNEMGKLVVNVSNIYERLAVARKNSRNKIGRAHV